MVPVTFFAPRTWGLGSSALLGGAGLISIAVRTPEREDKEVPTDV